MAELSSPFQFSLAGAEDDSGLRKRMREDTMDGSVSVSFRRDPDFFSATSIMGSRSQVIKCQDTRNSEIVGLGSRASYSATVLGEPLRVGYLSDLRAAPRVRGSGLIHKGYRFLKKLHDEDPLPFYISLIFEGNKAALQSLTRDRARPLTAFPRYLSLGRLETPAVFLRKKRPFKPLAGLEYRQATAKDMPRVFEFIAKENSRRSLAPRYTTQDLGTPRLAGLKPQDFFIVTSNDEILACLATWDQSELRQTYIESYSRSLKWMRPWINGFGKLMDPTRPQLLPSPGSQLHYFYLAFCHAAGDDVTSFESLLTFMYSIKRESHYNYFIPGFHERNPLLKVLKDFKRVDSSNELFLVCYSEDLAKQKSRMERLLHVGVPQIEIATL